MLGVNNVVQYTILVLVMLPVTLPLITDDLPPSLKKLLKIVNWVLMFDLSSNR